MVLGNGMIAKGFMNYTTNDDVVICASGVSNSKCTDDKEFEREYNLIKQTVEDHPEKKIVYISTCSIYDPVENKSQYVQHKLHVEQYIEQHADRYLIVRASNVVGKTGNKNTVFNFFVNCVKAGTPFNLWQHATRNLLDVDDFYKITSYILDDGKLQNEVVNIANPESYNVVHIVATIEEFLEKKAIYTLIDKGVKFEIPTPYMELLLKDIDLSFDKDYLINVLHKYYS